MDTFERMIKILLKVTVIMTTTAVVIWGLNKIKDYAAQKEKKKFNNVLVVDKHYTPERTTTVYTGKVLIPVHHSETFTIYIYDESLYCFNCHEELYNEINIGDYITINTEIYNVLEVN